MKINLRTFIGLNIILCSVLLGDAFILPGKVKTVLLTEFSSKLTRAKRTSYYNYFIYTSDNCKYEVTENLYENLRINDSVQILSSPIIKMPIEIHYWKNDQQYSSKIGQLNTNKSEKIGLIISLIISIILFLVQSLTAFNRLSPFFALQIIAFGTSFTVFLFVIIEVCFI